MNLLTQERSRVIIMAPGSSLSSAQVKMIKDSGLYTIAIGDAGRVMHPDADVLYHCDARWWEHYEGCPEFDGKMKVSLEKTKYENIHNMRRSPNRNGIDLNFPYIVTGTNSGYQAINLAMYCNPREIILVGYDMKKRDGKYNVIGDHPKAVKRPADFSVYLENMAELRPVLDYLDVKVYNCTIDSDLGCFERKELKDVL